MSGRIAVAMSGGVDSSTVAALLVREGHDCVGLTMQTWPAPAGAASSGRARGCCSITEIMDAERVAWRLGLSHYTLNIRDDFEATVIDDFVREYAAGRTPNPCVRCNQYIKFALFLERARALGAERVATGHYARIERDLESGRWLLLRGVDSGKDQSYVLYTMTQDQLAHTLFPLGPCTKEETRALARELGLRVADKRDSVEICFLPQGNHGAFVAARRPDAVQPGPIVDQGGRVLGEHRGLAWYTVGQRRGLGLQSTDPLFVIALDRARNEVVVGPADALARTVFTASAPNWIACEGLEERRDVTAQVRYNSTDVAAEIRPLGKDRIEVRLAAPARAVAPGQAVVFYEGERVVGGATIDG
jgi:tRNA-specific 2-thiouridylase